MEGSTQKPSLVPKGINKEKIEKIAKPIVDKLTVAETLAVAAYLLSYLGLVTNTHVLRSIAKLLFQTLDDLEEEDGLSHRSDLDRESTKVPGSSAED